MLSFVYLIFRNSNTLCNMSSNIYINIGRVVSTRRKKLGLTQQDLAGDADMERSYISAVENGYKKIQVDTLVRLAVALNIKPAKLLDEAMKL